MTLYTAIYAILAGTIPSIVWLIFWLQEDKMRPEPRWLISSIFIGGGLSVIAAIYGEQYIGELVSNTTLRYTLWAATEEIVKFLAVMIIALNSSYNDEPIDAMIYFITAALGFAAIENTLFVLSPLSNGHIAQSIATDSMRFIGATLVHIVSSALIGFSIGYTKNSRLPARIIFIALGILGAIAIHSGFNISIVGSQPSEILNTFMWIWFATVIMIVLFEEIKAVRIRHSDLIHSPLAEEQI
jgi:RsiW-degrading membrane proteinase PrsW (M82 family)